MNINVAQFMDTLPMMGFGMGGIFLIIGLIMLTIWIFNKTTKSKKED